MSGKITNLNANIIKKESSLESLRKLLCKKYLEQACADRLNAKRESLLYKLNLFKINDKQKLSVNKFKDKGYQTPEEWSKTEYVALKDALAAEITATKLNEYEGYLCFYCLGIYNERSVFELDHITPRLKFKNSGPGAAMSDAQIIERTNFSMNILPVCKTCNTTKGSTELKEPVPGGYASVEQKLLKLRMISRERYGFVKGLKKIPGRY